MRGASHCGSTWVETGEAWDAGAGFAVLPPRVEDGVGAWPGRVHTWGAAGSRRCMPPKRRTLRTLAPSRSQTSVSEMRSRVHRPTFWPGCTTRVPTTRPALPSRTMTDIPASVPQGDGSGVPGTALATGGGAIGSRGPSCASVPLHRATPASATAHQTLDKTPARITAALPLQRPAALAPRQSRLS